jgi:hypothetical protein
MLEDYWDVPCSSFNLLPALKGYYAGPIAYQSENASLSYMDLDPMSQELSLRSPLDEPLRVPLQS